MTSLRRAILAALQTRLDDISPDVQLQNFIVSMRQRFLEAVPGLRQVFAVSLGARRVDAARNEPPIALLTPPAMQSTNCADHEAPDAEQESATTTTTRPLPLSAARHKARNRAIGHRPEAVVRRDSCVHEFYDAHVVTTDVLTKEKIPCSRAAAGDHDYRRCSAAAKILANLISDP